MNRIKLATIWLDGCSGCHMSFLDIDERIVALLERADLVYSPLVDQKKLPDHIDVTLVEGAVSTDEDVEKIMKVRQRTKILVALGDCAVTGNIPAMRNPFGVEPTLERAYVETVQLHPQFPTEQLPRLLDTVRPVHDVVPVDLHVPGCPPHADTIFHVLSELLAGRMPDLTMMTRFGK